MIKKTFTTKGFTLVELMVSIGIFVLMTSLLLAKYGSFNQGIFLTNQAYDVALAIRTAQSYGINVKGVPGRVNDFNSPYGIYFDTSSDNEANKKIIFFADVVKDGVYTAGDTVISTYTLKKNTIIKSICIKNDSISCNDNHNDGLVNITFVRPSPKAIIKKSNINPSYKYAEISIKSSNGEIKKVTVTDIGQITIKD